MKGNLGVWGGHCKNSGNSKADKVEIGREYDSETRKETQNTVYKTQKEGFNMAKGEYIYPANSNPTLTQQPWPAGLINNTISP
jgi:hypothetical protein